jgi:hypothetical protein
MKHLLFGTPEEELERAVEFLRKELSPDMMEEIGVAMKASAHFEIDQHFGIGMSIRNLLRKGGFEWDALILDGQWSRVLRRAIKPTDEK